MTIQCHGNLSEENIGYLIQLTEGVTLKISRKTQSKLLDESSQLNVVASFIQKKTLFSFSFSHFDLSYVIPISKKLNVEV